MTVSPPNLIVCLGLALLLGFGRIFAGLFITEQCRSDQAEY